MQFKAFLITFLIIGYSISSAEPDFRTVVQAGHHTGVHSIDIDPHERYFISVGDGVMKIWDYLSCKIIRTVNASSSDMMIHPSGEWILQRESLTLSMIDWKTGNIIRTFPMKQNVYKCRFDKSGDHIIFITSGLGTVIVVFDIGTGQILNQFKICEEEIRDFDLDPSGDFIIVTGFDVIGKKRRRTPFIRRYNLNSGELIQEYGPKKHDKDWYPTYSAVRFDPLSKYIMVAIQEKAIQLWSYEENKLVREWSFRVSFGNPDYIFQPDTPMLWIADFGVIQVNYETGIVLNKLETYHYPMAINPSFETAISGSKENDVLVK